MKNGSMKTEKKSSILESKTFSAAKEQKSSSSSKLSPLSRDLPPEHMACTLYGKEGRRKALSLPSLQEIKESFLLFPELLPTLQEASSLFSSTRLLQILGTGRVSKIFKAQKIQTKEPLVVKIIDTSTEEGLQASKREMIFLSQKISHENIIRYLEGRCIKRYRLIYLEYFSDCDLYKLLSLIRKPPFSLIKRISSQLIDALIYLHERRIAHLDVKPENILIDKRFQIKLIDFGSSQISLRNGNVEAYGGSIHYASPEAIIGGIYNGFLADAWSFGVLFFLMLNGCYPKSRTLRKPSQESHPELQRVINGLLEKNPEKRRPISAQLKREINSIDITQEKDGQRKYPI